MTGSPGMWLEAAPSGTTNPGKGPRTLKPRAMVLALAGREKKEKGFEPPVPFDDVGDLASKRWEKR